MIGPLVSVIVCVVEAGGEDDRLESADVVSHGLAERAGAASLVLVTTYGWLSNAPMSAVPLRPGQSHAGRWMGNRPGDGRPTVSTGVARAGVDRGAAGQECDGWGRTPLEQERAELGVDVLDVGGGEACASRRVADQILTQRDEQAGDVGSAVLAGVAGDERPLKRRGAGRFVEHAAARAVQRRLSAIVLSTRSRVPALSMPPPDRVVADVAAGLVTLSARVLSISVSDPPL